MRSAEGQALRPNKAMAHSDVCYRVRPAAGETAGGSFLHVFRRRREKQIHEGKD